MRRFILRLVRGVPREQYDYAVDWLGEELAERSRLALAQAGLSGDS
jgi:hypothetical protein